jgi:hypothetical protein
VPKTRRQDANSLISKVELQHLSLKLRI